MRGTCQVRSKGVEPPGSADPVGRCAEAGPNEQKLLRVDENGARSDKKGKGRDKVEGGEIARNYQKASCYMYF